MRQLNLTVRSYWRVLVGVSLALAVPAAWSVIDAPTPTPAAPGQSSAQPQQGKSAYEAGVSALKEADAAASSSAQVPAAARAAYARARQHFQDATQKDPLMAEAWNGLGYSQRKLGDYAAALAAYGRALAVKPGYPEATEYRGEAYLALNRIADAKQAYLELYASNRTLADKLLGAMKHWIDGQSSAGDPNASAASELAKWVEERSRIASLTPGLTRESVATGWR